MSGATIGDLVFLKDGSYVVVGVGPASTDKKFWGKRKFIFRKSGTYDLFFGYGKSITRNMRLLPYTDPNVSKS